MKKRSLISAVLVFCLLSITACDFFTKVILPDMPSHTCGNNNNDSRFIGVWVAEFTDWFNMWTETHHYIEVTFSVNETGLIYHRKQDYHGNFGLWGVVYEERINFGWYVSRDIIFVDNRPCYYEITSTSLSINPKASFWDLTNAEYLFRLHTFTKK